MPYVIPVATADQFDEDGLVRDFESWSEALAEELAKDAGIGQLTEAHWKIIGLMRAHYATLGVAPAINRICRDAGIERQQVNALFGYCLVAWRVAGLPNPGEETKAYLSSM